MRTLLWLGVLVVACSSEPNSGDNGKTGEPSSGGASGGTLAGAQSVGGAGSSAVGGGAISAAAGRASAVAVAGDGGQSGDATAGTGAGGAVPTGGAGGAAGGYPSSELGGAAGAADGGSTGGDPCAGVQPWNPAARWPDYASGDQRSFGGLLWKCQAPTFCHTYPDHEVSDGWIKVDECSTGPTGEVAECQCQAGACCDGCYLRARSYFCGEVVRSSRCTASERIEHDYWNLFCSGDGDGAECTRWGVHTKYSAPECGAGLVCFGPDGAATCEPE